MASRDGLGATPDLVKLYYRIGEVSQIVGVQPHVLRYWESEFHSIRPQKSRKGQRVYSRLDVEKLLRVKDLLRNQGFTIAGAKRRLHAPGTVREGIASASAPALGGTPPAGQAASQGLETSLTERVPGADRALRAVAFVPQARSVDGSVPHPAHRAVTEDRSNLLAFDGRGEAAFASPPLTRFTAAAESVRNEGGPSAKSLRRRLVEIRRDVLRMLAEFSG